MLINLYNLSFLDLSEITLDFLSRHIKNIVPPKCFQLSSKARISRRNSNTGASYGYRFQGEILIIIMVIFFLESKTKLICFVHACVPMKVNKYIPSFPLFIHIGCGYIGKLLINCSKSAVLEKK